MSQYASELQDEGATEFPCDCIIIIINIFMIISSMRKGKQVFVKLLNSKIYNDNENGDDIDAVDDNIVVTIMMMIMKILMITILL